MYIFHTRELHVEKSGQSYCVRYILWSAAYRKFEINNRHCNIGRSDKPHRTYCTNNARCNQNAADRPLEKCIWSSSKFAGSRAQCLSSDVKNRAQHTIVSWARDFRMRLLRKMNGGEYFRETYECITKAYVLS